mmetsp:Transcript_39098/g.123287  ORF Transcript_39098/g.123287 Transcript_39098/m.123287 type:complete len:114 (-) Transcript_39098:322-663(-)
MIGRRPQVRPSEPPMCRPGGGIQGFFRWWRGKQLSGKQQVEARLQPKETRGKRRRYYFNFEVKSLNYASACGVAGQRCERGSGQKEEVNKQFLHNIRDGRKTTGTKQKSPKNT